MLSQRKRYNYNVAPSTHASRRAPSSSSAYKSTILYQNENINIDHIEEPTATVPESKRISQLEAANKKMLEETTKQFQKFEADVVKVETILRIKEQTVERLQSENKGLLEDKTALIQALQQKQAIIQQFHEKLRELLEQRQLYHLKKTETETSQTQTSTSISTSIEAQTEPETESPLLNEVVLENEKYQQEHKKVQNLTEQVYKLKQQLYESNSELGLIKQQFQTYKLLHQIEEVRKL